MGSLLLSPGSWSAQVLFLPSKSLSPHSCVNSGGSVVGLMAVSSKRAYATPRSAAPRAPAPVVGHCWHIPPQDSLKHSKAGLAQSLWGLFMCTRFCLSHLSIYIYTSRLYFSLEPGLWKEVQFSSVQLLSHVRLFATPWITARQASLSITNSQSLGYLSLNPISLI